MPFGIVTERDLVDKIVAGAADPSKVTVAEMMTAPLVTIDAAAPLIDVGSQDGGKAGEKAGRYRTR